MRSFEADENLITWNSSSEWCGYFVFIDIPAYCLQNFIFGGAEASFLHQLKTLGNFFFVFMEEESSWSSKRLAFYPSQFLIMFESHRGHGYLSVVSVVCRQVEVSATS